MKIRFEQSVDVSGEVAITSEDIISALDEALIDAIETESSDVPTERTKQLLVMQFVSDVYKCLKGTTDAMITRVAPSNRRMVAMRLREQADRWDTTAANETPPQ